MARKGHTFIVSDFSSIEARVLSYMAREKWRMDVFAGNLDIYTKSASKMFSKPVVKGGINSELRQKGKIAELALGYGGGRRGTDGYGRPGHGAHQSRTAKTCDHMAPDQSPHRCLLVAGGQSRERSHRAASDYQSGGPLPST